MKLNNILLTVLIVLLSVFTFLFFIKNSDKTEDQNYYEAASRQYRIFNLKIPDSLNFAGEAVPLENYFVRERLEREMFAIAFLHSRTSMALKRTARYFPIFEETFKANGIPDDFKFLAMAESELAFPVSPAGAAGIWQFLKATAIQYGLEVNEEVDERYHVYKSTLAAAKFLNDLNKRFKNWTLTAAAYNMGPTRLPGFMADQQETSYYNLALFEETNRYVYRILAYKIIYNNPTQYGFYFRNKDLHHPIPYDKVIVDTSITSLAAFAKSLNINLQQLKEHNQWLRRNSLIVRKGTTYEILVPQTLLHNEIQKNIKKPNFLMNDSLILQ